MCRSIQRRPFLAAGLPLLAASAAALRPEAALQVQDARALLQGHLRSGDPPPPVPATPSPVVKNAEEEWGTRLGGGFLEILSGLVLVMFSFPVLWFNESRSARIETLICRARWQARSIGTDAPDADNRNWLVHVEDVLLTAAAPVSDPRFDVTFRTGCLRLQSSIEVLQMIQREVSESRERYGCSRETKRTYKYAQEWSDQWHNSDDYQDPSKRVNRMPSGLKIGHATTNSPRVECGRGFLLSDALISQCSLYKPASDRLGPCVTSRVGGLLFKKEPDGYFYYRPSGGAPGSPPKIGDIRVGFSFVAEGRVTVMGLQVESAKDQTRDTFLPYRLVERGWCGLTQSQEKQALRAEAEKSLDELRTESRYNDRSCLFCCACDLVSGAFASFATPQILHLWDGSIGARDCIETISERSRRFTWLIRLAGWLVMFAGFFCFFKPLIGLVGEIPGVGPSLAKLGCWLIWFLCGVSTLGVSGLVVAIAYLAYHPCIALGFAGLVSLGCAFLLFVPEFLRF